MKLDNTISKYGTFFNRCIRHQSLVNGKLSTVVQKANINRRLQKIRKYKYLIFVSPPESGRVALN